MPLQPLRVPSDSNCFFSAFSLGLMLPVFKDGEPFNKAMECLFGSVTRTASDPFIQELKNHTLDTFPASLSSLINTKLRPKLVEYIKTHRSEFVGLFASEQEFERRVDLIMHPNTPCETFEINALSAMTGVIAHIHNELFISGLISNSSVSTQPALHLTFVNDTYYYYINPDDLSEVLQQQLFPLKVRIPEQVDVRAFQQAKSKQLLQHMLREIPTHLATISERIQLKPNVDALSPVDSKFIVRINAQSELKTMRPAMKKVQLTQGYDLDLLKPLGCTEAGVLYIKISNSGFRYKVKGQSKNLYDEGFIEYQALAADISSSVTIEELKLFLPKILAITQGRGHTLPINPVEIGGVKSWTKSLGTSAGVSAVSGGAALGTAMVVGEVVGVGAGFALTAPVTVPVAVGVLMAMGVAVYGKSFAITYERALERVTTLLSQGLFTDAAEALDAEFNRRTLGTRNLFLSQQHHLMAHFSRAICAKELDRKEQAYIHYQEAYKAAERAGIQDAMLILKLQLLALLNNSTAEDYIEYQEAYKVYERVRRPVTTYISGIQSQYVLENGTNDSLSVIARKEVATDNLIQELTVKFNPGFTNFYRSLLERLDFMAKRFSSFEPLSVDEIQLANEFLLVHAFYILKHYEAGFGAFIEIVSVLFKGAILGFFGHIDPTYLDEHIKATLVSELSGRNAPEEFLENRLALEKFTQASTLLYEFKKKNQEAIKKYPIILSIITFIETFILKFSAVWIDDENFTLENYHNCNVPH